MPANLAVLALVLGTPIALLGMLPASLLFQRLMRPRATALARLYLTPDAAAAVKARVQAGAEACLAALLVSATLALALLFAVPPDSADRRIPPLIAPLATAAGLFVLLVWPMAPARHAGVSVPAHVGRRLVIPALGATGVLLVLVLVAGLVSVPDTPSPRYVAFPAPAPTAWTYDDAGLPTDIDYTPHGVTPGWPGWFYGGPILAALLPIAFIAAGAWARVNRWTPLPAAAAAADSFTRTLVVGVISCLVGVGCTITGAWLLATAGETLVAVSVVPRPTTGLAPGAPTAGHLMPLYAVGQAARFAWVVLVPVAITLVWLAVLATRELMAGARAARSVLGHGAGTHE